MTDKMTMISHNSRRGEGAARWLVLGILIGLPLAVLAARWLLPAWGGTQWTEIRARMPERGGFIPGDLTVAAGTPLHLRLVSDDVLHGFAIGQSGEPGIDLKPGEVVETTLQFDQPGKYTYYCTRWCGPNHWRMRGVIEVTPGEGGVPAGAGTTGEAPQPPLYVTLGLDLDAPHPAPVTPEARPSASRSAALGVELPERMLERTYFQAHSAAEAWQELRGLKATEGLSDQQVWDLVARLWQANTTPERLAQGAQLYAQNCAACHGEAGQGDGVMADDLTTGQTAAGQANDEAHGADNHTPAAGPSGHETLPPTDFTDPQQMLGASPAILHGKIVRGGMGTGMPYWGPIFTEDEIWMLVEYLVSFQFDE